MGWSLNHAKNWTRILNITAKYWTLLHKILSPGFKILWPEILNPSLIFICSWTGVQDISSRGRCRYHGREILPHSLPIFNFYWRGVSKYDDRPPTSDFYLLYERRFKTSRMRNIDNPPPPSTHFLTYMYFQTTFKIGFYKLFPWNILAIPPPPLIYICYWGFKIYSKYYNREVITPFRMKFFFEHCMIRMHRQFI